jgi:GTP-binding protein
MNQKIDWKAARYERSGPGEDLPVIKGPQGHALPEVAFSGRSNSGKSSLLNDLTEHKELARVSNTPGKTQLIHLFPIPSSLVLVDLPGYGFAKVPEAVKRSWGEGLEHYFTNRDSLALILLLLDIRRLPSHEDIQMLEWARHYKKNITLILTKIDKVTAQERKKNTEAIIKTFNEPSLPFLHYSVLQDAREARRELRSHIIQQILSSREPS